MFYVSHLLELVLAACATEGIKEIEWSYEPNYSSTRVTLATTGTTLEFTPPVANRAYNIFVEGKCNDERPFSSMIRVFPPVCCPYEEPRVAPTGGSETTILADYDVFRSNGEVTITPKSS